MYETAERERVSAGSVSIRSAARRHMGRARFGTVAICAVGVLIVSGAWLAWTHIGTPAQMLTTPYGRHLTVKLVMVAAMPVVGTCNSRVLLPGIAAARERGDHAPAGLLALRNFPVAVEAILAVGVLLVVPFLAGSGRTQAGRPAARAFDPTVFGTGVLLVALVAAALWAGGRARVGWAPVREMRCGAE
ncbi:CopD family protein [Nocardia sp. NEAU-G5]|uniref:CopD family protein n=1 Tax=Nocardia albiluteola TaxID=2842303 RepID=A0ABS6BCM8_9NOCA|nr:CopD family protein [Nocardia albiluteola]MBU3067165.1 CopD family protein [Nocardia albiluteola]